MVEQTTVPKNETEFSFINIMSNVLKKVSKEYIFKLTDEIKISMNVDSLNYQAFLEKIKEIEFIALRNFVNEDSIVEKNKSEFLNYFSKKKENNILDTSNNSLVIRVNDTTTSYDKNVIDSLLTVYLQRHSDSLLREIVFPKSEYTRVVEENLIFNENQREQIKLLYKKSFGNDDFRFIGNYTAHKNDTNISVYEASIKQNSKQKYFELRMCKDETYNCDKTIKLDLSISRKLFYSQVLSLLNNFKDTITDINVLESLYQKCISYNQEELISYNTQPYKKVKDSLLSAIENIKTNYSGMLKLNEEIPIEVTEYSDSCNGIKSRKMSRIRKYKYKSENRFENCKEREWFYDIRKYKYKSKIENKLCKIEKLTNFVFKPKYATVRFFNNRVKKIVLVGDIVNKITNEKEEFISINFNYSIPMRTLNDKTGETNSIDCSMFDNGTISYSDVFNYYPYEHTHNYSVKNKEYRIEVGDSVKIEERKLADYITPVIFSDFLGLNSNNSNGLVQAEAVAIIPLWIRNYKKYSLFPSIRVEFNASLYNGFDDESRFINEQGFSTFDSTLISVNPFDFVKFANLNTGVSLNLFSAELKGLSSTINIGLGGRYLKSGFKYTQIDTSLNNPDVITRDQLNSLSTEWIFNLQIRPQANFGADIFISHNYIHPAGSKNGAIIDNLDVDFNQRQFMRFSLDLYSKINPDVSQGGIYARLGGFFHYKTQEFYPQIMVGYATNLSSFVNRFSKD